MFEQTMIRKARLIDAKQIQILIKDFADNGEMLPRSFIQIYEYIRDFFVYEIDGDIHGVCALHVCWEDLAEIRSLAVKKEKQRKGTGNALVESCIKESIDLGIKKIFALTYKPDFFKKSGFVEIDKSELPHKVWQDCLYCHKFPGCDEIALAKIL